MEYKEIKDDNRVYIVPVGTAFVPTGRQPKPDKDAVFAVGVGDDCPMLEKRLCVGIDDRNLTYRCKYLLSCGEKTNGSIVLEWVQCAYKNKPTQRSVKVLKTTPHCGVDEVGCIHPILGSLEKLKRCPYLAGYVPSNLSVAHDHIVCLFLTTLNSE